MTLIQHFYKNHFRYSSGRARKYLLYAIGEIALVVIGIPVCQALNLKLERRSKGRLVAVQTINWNQDGKK